MIKDLLEMGDWLTGGKDNAWVREWDALATEALKKPEPKCVCGSSITMGKDDHPTFHDDVCEVRKKYERDNK